jgi:nicotinamide riboside transporter PnuC
MIFMVAALWGQWYWFRSQAKREAAGRAPAMSASRSRAVTWAIGAVVIVSAVGATTIIALVGDAGARAVWESTFH